MFKKSCILMCAAAVLFSAHVQCSADTRKPEIVILGTTKAAIDFYKSKDFWGPIDDKKKLTVPRVIVVAVNDNWKQDADKLPVDLKKEFFFRAIIPMILYENQSILADRDRLKSLAKKQEKGLSLKEEDLKWLHKLVLKYAVAAGKNAEGAS